MITVSISTNGEPIFARTAVNRGTQKTGRPGDASELHVYEVDDGTNVLHCPNEGAVALAHKLLDTICEQKER